MEITEVEIVSKFGLTCRIDVGGKVRVKKDGKSVRLESDDDGSYTFDTTKGGIYTLVKL